VENNFSSRRKCILLKQNCKIEENLMRFFVIVFLISFELFAQIKVSEVMRNPVGRKTDVGGGRTHQYIEIVNLGGEAVSISGMRLFTGAIIDSILPIPKNAISQGTSGTSEIKPGQIAMILDREIIDVYGQFPLNIPDTVVVLTVNHVSICGGFAANDGFVILNGNDTIAECRNSLENGRFKSVASSNETEGFSIIPQSLFENSGVWNVEKPSVGKIDFFNNGVLREYKIEKKDGEFECEILYGNFAKNAIIEGENLQDKGEIFVSKPLSSSAIFELNIDGATIFDTVFTANLFVKERSVVITEIDSRAATEWMELYWKDECFPLDGWHLLVGGSVVNLPRIECPPNRILCVSEKESDGLVKMTRVANWRKVNNYSDTVYLVAPFGAVDSIAWTSEIFAGSSDKSTVQRRDVNKSGFDADNVFAGAASPGAVLRFEEIKKFAISLSSKKFTPNGDGNLDSLVISAQKPRNGTVKIEIYSMDGNLLKTFESATQSRFVWDGKNEFGRIAEVGAIFVIGTFDDKKSKVSDRKNAVLWR
jgi:hypothetical protein